MKPRLRRILIDCSFIDFSRQPTGIPRVVLAYIEVGYRWGIEHGIEVIPVVPSSNGIFIVRPVPGRGVPNNLKARLGQLNSTLVTSILRGCRLAALKYFSNLGAYFLLFLASLLGRRSILENKNFVDAITSASRNGSEAANGFDSTGGALLKLGPGDLMFCPAYWHDVNPQIYKSIKESGCKVVILVHDLLPILFEKFYNAPWRYLFRDNVKEIYSFSDAIFSVSTYTRSAVREFGYRHKQKIPPLATAYNGFEPLTDINFLSDIASGKLKSVFGGLNADLFQVEDKPFLCVGSIEPKKGHIPVIKTLEGMWRAGYSRNLVIIGRVGWMQEEIVSYIEQSEFYGKKLFWLRNISDFELAYAYHHCRALIFSSIGEGFGIPMIEAASYGKPAIVYDSEITREVLGERGNYFKCAKSLVDSIMSLENDHFYAERCVRAREVQWPSWDEYTPKVFDALKKVYSGDIIPEVI